MKAFERGLQLTLISTLLLGCSSEDDRQGMIAANVRAIQEARRIQAEIAANERCPDSLVGWQRDQSGLFLVTVAGTAKMHYVLSFDCSQPDLSFGILVKYSFDSGPWVLGSAAGPLEIEHGHFTAPRTFKIASTDDAAVVAARVVYESYSP